MGARMGMPVAVARGRAGRRAWALKVDRREVGRGTSIEQARTPGAASDPDSRRGVADAGPPAEGKGEPCDPPTRASRSRGRVGQVGIPMGVDPVEERPVLPALPGRAQDESGMTYPVGDTRRADGLSRARLLVLPRFRGSRR